MVGTGSKWTLDLGDGVVLTDPAGNPVRFPYRKVEELFVKLSQSGPAGLRRESLRASLWPEVEPESGRLNLRQTLSRLRKSIGGDALESTRTHCRLRHSFCLEIKGALGRDSSDCEIDPLSPMGGFARVVEWLSEADPRQMLELMRTSIEFSCSLPVDVLDRVIDLAARRLPHNSPWQSWVHFWRGYSCLAVRPIQEARASFVLCANFPETRKDALLISECFFWWGALEILLGCPERALKLAERAETALATLGAHDRRFKIDSLRGTVLLHLGRDREAVQLLESINGYRNLSALDYASHEVLRAFYFATLDDFESCRRALEFPMKQAAASGITSLDSLCGLATGVMESRECPERAVATLDSLIHKIKKRKSSHYELYAHETLAVTHLRLGNMGDCRQALSRAKGIRERMGMKYTGWDLKRLQPIAVAAPQVVVPDLLPI